MKIARACEYFFRSNKTLTVYVEIISHSFVTAGNVFREFHGGNTGRGSFFAIIAMLMCSF